MDDDVNRVIVDNCLGIADRYPIRFLEMGTDKDHIHLLSQSVTKNSPTVIVPMIKCINAKKIIASFFGLIILVVTDANVFILFCYWRI